MIQRFLTRILLLALGGNLALSTGFAAPQASDLPKKSAAQENTAAQVLLSEKDSKATNAFRLLSPGPADSSIAMATAFLLQKYHYTRHAFDADYSSKFLDEYLETYDPQHLHFLQSDIAEFDLYRTNLNHMILGERRADTRPAYQIFNRFFQRLQQRVAYADELLKNEKFTFDKNERIVLNRKGMPYPKDLDEAKKLWRERLRYEYLQEKLGKLDAKKKTAKTETNSVAGSSEAKPKKTDAEEIVETLSHRYHRNLRTFQDLDNDDVLQFYLTALAHVYDPHSDYFNKASLDSFSIAMNLSLFGIGAELTSEDGYCTINRLLPGGPATKSNKINVKDRIVAVAQSNQPPVDVVDMSLNKAVQLIRGPKGTEVRLTIIPAGDSAARKEVSLIRDEIPLEDQAAKAKIIDLPDPRGQTVRIGVIDLPSFYATFPLANERKSSEPKSTTTDVARLLTKLKQENVKGVILDLRRNGGGSLEEAINLTGLFIKEGPVVQVKGFDGTIQEDDDRDPSVLYDGPLVVLTSRFSASASEILAGALQDYGRALIVGDSSTHGKGTVQMVQQLKEIMRAGSYPTNYDPGALKLTIKKFYRASGASTQKEGVVPDIVLPSVLNESKDIGEKALDHPLPWDTIPSASYDRLNMVEPYVKDLRRLSTARLATDKEYSYIREDIELFKQHEADKTVSLNEKERLKEKEENDARMKARDKERLARKEPPEKVYEISLKQALLPGLPPPVTRTNLATAKLDGKQGVNQPALNTNSAVAAAEAGDRLGQVGPEDEADEEKAPAVDALLNESEHILVDYASLLGKSNLATATTAHQP